MPARSSVTASPRNSVKSSLRSPGTPFVGHILPARGPVGIVACDCCQRRRVSRTASASTSTTPTGSTSPFPATGAGIRIWPRATARSCTAGGSTARRLSLAGGAGSRSTGSSTRRTCGSTAPISATPRATSSPTASTSRRSPASVTTTRSPSRWRATMSRARAAGATSPGLLHHSEAVDRDWNPGGLWRSVLLYDTGPAKLDRLRVLCREPRRQPRPRPSATPASTVTRPAPCACERSPTGQPWARQNIPLAAGSQRDRMGPRSSTGPGCGGPAPSDRSHSPTIDVEFARRRRDQRSAVPQAHAGRARCSRRSRRA